MKIIKVSFGQKDNRQRYTVPAPLLSPLSLIISHHGKERELSDLELS